MGKKLESSLFNMVISLAVITFAAGVSLGFVQQITQTPIEQSLQAKEIEAISNVLPEFTNNPLETAQKIEVDSDSLVVYTAKNNDEVIGYAVLSSTKSGFSGLVKVMVGFTPDGKIYNTSVVEHSETPGLGDKMNTEKFRSQFKNFDCTTQNANVKKDGGDIDAITAATISSRAFCATVRKAFNAYANITNTSQNVDAESGATVSADSLTTKHE